MKIGKEGTKPPADWEKGEAKKKVKAAAQELQELLRVLYAQGKYSVLVVLQGMDASGKDGSVRNVFKYVPAYSMAVKSFKKPTPIEMAHDFLWRVHLQTPPKGQLHVFNRSHYEDVLIQRVHAWINMDTVKKRWKQINDFESMLVENNTIVIKFFLNISFERQEEKLTKRTQERESFWKHNDGDWEQRKFWDQYMDAYADVLKECNAPEWNIVPADDNRYKEYYIATTIVKELKKLDLDYPDLDSELF